jgi:hypothetical protein
MTDGTSKLLQDIEEQEQEQEHNVDVNLWHQGVSEKVVLK